MDVRGHCDLASILVLRGAGFQANRPCGNVDLLHLEVDTVLRIQTLRNGSNEIKQLLETDLTS